jgi:hypothetical protein
MPFTKLKENAMQRVYLTRRNLLTLLSKLDRNRELPSDPAVRAPAEARGAASRCALIKQDTTHHKYPYSDVIEVTAVEDADYYTDREPGPVVKEDEPHGYA